MQWCRSFLAIKAIANLSWVLRREHRAGCRLPPALLPARRNHSPDTVRSSNLSKSTLAHDAVAAVVLHKHDLIIRVGAGLIQFVYRSHSHLATEFTYHRNALSPFFARVFSKRVRLWLLYFKIIMPQRVFICVLTVNGVRFIFASHIFFWTIRAVCVFCRFHAALIEAKQTWIPLCIA